MAKISSLKDAAASLSKAIDARSTAEALRDQSARHADEAERALAHADSTLAERSAAAASAREDARRAQANVAATREAASKARRDAPLVERFEGGGAARGRPRAEKAPATGLGRVQGA